MRREEEQEKEASIPTTYEFDQCRTDEQSMINYLKSEWNSILSETNQLSVQFIPEFENKLKLKRDLFMNYLIASFATAIFNIFCARSI